MFFEALKEKAINCRIKFIVDDTFPKGLDSSILRRILGTVGLDGASSKIRVYNSNETPIIGKIATSKDEQILENLFNKPTLISSGNNNKSEKLISICNLVVFYNIFNW